MSCCGAGNGARRPSHPASAPPTPAGSKLYILNGQFKCAKEGCSADDEAAVAELRRVAASFDAGALSSSGGGDGGTAQ